MSFINTFISTHVSEYQGADMRRAIQILTDAGQVLHTDEIDKLLISDSLGSANEYVTAIHEILYNVSETTLRDFGVLLNHEVPDNIGVTIDIIETMLRIPTYEQKSDIINIITNDESDNEEKLAELCMLFTELDEHQLYIHIDSISEKIWEDISVALGETDSQPETDVINIDLSERVKTAREITKAFLLEDDDSDVIMYLETAHLGYDINNALNLLFPTFAKESPAVMISYFWLLIAGSSTKDQYGILELLLEKILSPIDIVNVTPIVSKFRNSII